MSFSETIFLFFLALIVFGSKKLPEIARQVGKWMAEFRRASNEFKSQIEQEIAHLEAENKQTILPPSPAPEGTASRTLDAAPSEVSKPQDAGTSAPSDDEPLFASPAAETAPAVTGDASANPLVSETQESHV